MANLGANSTNLFFSRPLVLALLHQFKPDYFLEPPKLLAEAMESEQLPKHHFEPLKIGETLVLKNN
jgi:hypothetical protein